MSENDKSDALEIMRLQSILEQEELAIEQAHPEVFAQIKLINERKDAVDKLWEKLKEKLIEAGDTDIHEVREGDYKCTFSISKTSKVGVVDIDKVPAEFVETQKVANAKKLKQYYELYGEVPEGCEDKSFYRLNKKIVLDKSLGEGINE